LAKVLFLLVKVLLLLAIAFLSVVFLGFILFASVQFEVQGDELLAELVLPSLKLLCESEGSS